MFHYRAFGCLEAVFAAGGCCNLLPGVEKRRNDCRGVDCRLVHNSVAIGCRNASKTVDSVSQERSCHYLLQRPEQQWIAETRQRLAQRRGKKPATKAGQIRALWPEIQAAIADGQSLASIRQWLEEEGGVVTVREVWAPTSPAYDGKSRPNQFRTNAAVSMFQPGLSERKPRSARPGRNLRETSTKKRGFEYPPGPPDESKLI